MAPLQEPSRGNSMKISTGHYLTLENKISLLRMKTLKPAKLSINKLKKQCARKEIKINNEANLWKL